MKTNKTQQSSPLESRFGKGLIPRIVALQYREDAQRAVAQIDTAYAGMEPVLARLSVAANMIVWK